MNGIFLILNKTSKMFLKFKKTSLFVLQRRGKMIEGKIGNNEEIMKNKTIFFLSTPPSWRKGEGGHESMILFLAFFCFCCCFVLSTNAFYSNLM